MLKLSNKQFEMEYKSLLDYTKEIIDNKYPCGEGGWIHYRVTTSEQLDDIKKLLKRKVVK